MRVETNERIKLALGAFFFGIIATSAAGLWVLYNGHLPSYAVDSVAQGGILSLGMVVTGFAAPHLRKRKAERHAGTASQ